MTNSYNMTHEVIWRTAITWHPNFRAMRKTLTTESQSEFKKFRCEIGLIRFHIHATEGETSWQGRSKSRMSWFISGNGKSFRRDFLFPQNYFQQFCSRKYCCKNYVHLICNHSNPQHCRMGP